MKELPQRKPTRLKDYDYSRTGAYFVTICAKDRAEIFSRIVAVGDGLARPDYPDYPDYPDCPDYPAPPADSAPPTNSGPPADPTPPADPGPPACPAPPVYPIVELTDIGEQIMQMLDYVNQRYDNAFVDKFVIMPNHIHLILVINGCDETGRVCETGRANGTAGRASGTAGRASGTAGRASGTAGRASGTAGRASPSPTVGNIIGGLKSGVSRNIGFSPWQRFFHDHIIRNADDYARIAEYIENNPRNWREDCFYAK